MKTWQERVERVWTIEGWTTEDNTIKLASKRQPSAEGRLKFNDATWCKNVKGIGRILLNHKVAFTQKFSGYSSTEHAETLGILESVCFAYPFNCNHFH